MDNFWSKEDGEKVERNWFKEHPNATMLILFGAVVVIVLVTII